MIRNPPSDVERDEKEQHKTLVDGTEKDPYLEDSARQQQSHKMDAHISFEQTPSAFRLRFYQDLIAAQATKTNTIAYLPTGSGKTFIAYRVIEYRLQFVRVSRNNTSDWPRVIIFIAPKRALLHQQIQSIRKFCVGVKAEEFGGSTLFNNKKIDQWGIDEWRHHLQSYEVLGMTPATLQTLLEKKLLPFNTIDLLVLDECHHASGHDPMAKLCDALKLSGHKPLILGLTASPVKSKRVQIQKAIEMLEDRTMCTFFLPSEKFTQSLRQFAFKTPVIVTSYNDISKGIGRNGEASNSSCSDFSLGLMKDDLSLGVHEPGTEFFAGDDAFSSVLKSISDLYIRVVCTNYIQQLHDSDVLLNRRAFTLLSEKFNVPNARLSHFIGIKHIRECLRQLYDSTLSCGVFFGFQTISFFLEKIVSGLHRSRRRSNSSSNSSIENGKPFADTLQDDTIDDLEQNGAEESDEETTIDSILVPEENFLDVDPDGEAELPPRKKKRTNDFQHEEKRLPPIDDADMVKCENLIENMLIPDAMKNNFNQSPSFFTHETQERDSETVFTADNSMEEDLDWSLVDIPAMNDFEDSNASFVDCPNDGHGSNQHRKTLKRKLQYHSYHTFDLDQMKRNTPFIFKHIQKDINYYQFLLNQFDCGIVTILQTIQLLTMLCEESVVQIVIEKHRSKLEKSANHENNCERMNYVDEENEPHEHENNKPQSILLQILQETLQKKSLSWQEINLKMKSFSYHEIVREAISITHLFLQNIPLLQLENVSFRRSKTEVSSSPSTQENSLSDPIRIDESPEAQDAVSKSMDCPPACANYYFFPKVIRLFSLLWAIWRRGEKDSDDCVEDELYYEFIDDEAYLKKIDREAWLTKLQLALQPTTASATMAGLNHNPTKNPSISELRDDCSQESPEPHKDVLSSATPENNIETPDVRIAGMPSTIVFCNKKVTAWALNHIFRRLWNNRIQSKAINDGRLVRSNVLTGDIAVDKQRAVLQQFRDDDIQVLFATEVAEEGLDIKQCSSIVNFDQPSTVKAFIQRRGRARAQNSLNINLWPSMSSNEPKFNSYYRDMRSFLRTERRFDSQFISYTKKLFEATSTDDTEKYSVPSTGAYVDCVSAQALVFEYCQLLLQKRGSLFEKNDAFAENEPEIKILEEDDLGGTLPFYTFESYVDPILDEKVYVTTLHMPTAANAPPFAWTTSKKHQGKGRAALEAVKFLHEHGILDDHLRVLENLREVSPYEELARKAKRNKNLLLESELNSEDAIEGKVDLIVKTVPDSLATAPVLQDNDYGEAKLLLHFYGIRVHIDTQGNAVNEENISSQRPHNVTYEALKALQGVAFAVPSVIDGCSVHDLPTKWKATFRELSEDKFTWSFHYLGQRQVSFEEVGMMQAFHMSVLNLQVSELPAQHRDKYGFFPCSKSFWGNHFEQISEGDDVLATMPYVKPEEWSRSSNGAWYVIAPVHVAMSMVVCPSQDTEIEKHDPWLTVSELFQTAASAMACINNLNFIRNILASPSGQTVDIVADHDLDENQHLGDYMFTSNGRNIIRLDPSLPCTTSLLDIMDSKTNTSYATYFQKRGPLSQEFIASLLTENADSTDKEIEAKKKMVSMETISSKFTFWNLISKAHELQETSTKNAKRRNSSANHTRSQSTLPSLCWKLGYLDHYYQCMLLPSVAYRFLSLSLASELRSIIQTRWSPVRLSRKMLSTSDSDKRDNRSEINELLEMTLDKASTIQADSVASSDIFRDDTSLLPSLTSILEAMTSSRAHETLVSERLEFLGDAFLKMAATLEAYVTYPDATEGELSTRCKYVICNRTLSKLATSQDLAKYLRVFPLSRGLEELYLRSPGLANEMQTSPNDTIDKAAAASDTLAMATDDDDGALEEGEIRETDESPDSTSNNVKEGSNRPSQWLPCLRNANLHMPRPLTVNSKVAKQSTEPTTEATDTPVVPTDEELIRQAFQPEHIPCKQCQLAKQLPSKVLADIMEALLGACVNQTPLSQGLEAASMMAQSVKILKHDYVYLLAHATLEERFQIFHFPREQSLNAVLIPHPNQLQYSELDMAIEMDTDTKTPNESGIHYAHQPSTSKNTFDLTAIVREESTTIAKEADTIDDHRQKMNDNDDEDDGLLLTSAVVTEQPLPTSLLGNDISCSFRRHALPLATSTLQQLQTALQYTFHCPSLLGVAFTHASMSFEFLSYDRLEFLGDAVLDFIVAKRLFDMHPTWEEGHLSESKHAHTNNKYLSKLGAKLQVLRFVRHNSSAILRILPTLYGEDEDNGNKVIDIDDDNGDDGKEDSVEEGDRDEICQDQGTIAPFEDEDILPLATADQDTGEDDTQKVLVESNTSVTKPKQAKEVESTKTHKTRKTPQNHTDVVDIPESIVKIQADIVEAIVGAVYLDCGGDLTQVTQMLTHLGLFADSMSIKPVFVSTPATTAAGGGSAAKNQRDTDTTPTGKKANKKILKPTRQRGTTRQQVTEAISSVGDTNHIINDNDNAENATPQQQTFQNSHNTPPDENTAASAVDSNDKREGPINPTSNNTTADHPCLDNTPGHKRPHDTLVEDEEEEEEDTTLASKRPKLDLPQ